MNHLKEVYIDIRDEIFDALDAASLVDVEPLELESQLKDSVNILIEKKATANQQFEAFRSRQSTTG